MRRGRVAWSGGLVVGALGLLVGCLAVTVNVTFPQEKLEKAASSIEDLVRGEPAPPPTSPPKKDDKQGHQRPATSALAWITPRMAEAQVPELKVRTPEVMAAIKSRRERFPQVQQWKERGCIGENNRGLLEARPGQACGPEVRGLIAAETRDRMIIYRTLVEQNNMPPEELMRVQAAFAKIQRENAGRGQWIQSAGGQWTKK